MKVTLTNYIFPIIFSYRGWIVTLNDASTFFQFSDVKVKVNIFVDRDYYYKLLNVALRKPWDSSFVFGSTNNIDRSLYDVLSRKISNLLDSVDTYEYIESANGGLLDRFLGQNLSGIEKVQEKVKKYIDKNLNLDDVNKQFINILSEKGVNFIL